jgi:hypothetical protein
MFDVLLLGCDGFSALFLRLVLFVSVKLSPPFVLAKRLGVSLVDVLPC